MIHRRVRSESVFRKLGAMITMALFVVFFWNSIIARRVRLGPSQIAGVVLILLAMGLIFFKKIEA